MVDGSLKHAVQILEIGFGGQCRQLLQELVHLPEEQQNDEADNHKNKDTKASNARIIATTRDSLIMPCAMRTCAIALTSG